MVEPGKVLIAPGDFHLRIRKDGDAVKARLDQSPPENSCRPAVDVLFRSVSEVYGGSGPRRDPHRHGTGRDARRRSP